MRSKIGFLGHQSQILRRLIKSAFELFPPARFGFAGGGENCYLWMETRVDVIDEEDLELMSRLNIKMDFGIDSFSTSMLKIMNKTKNPNAFL